MPRIIKKRRTKEAIAIDACAAFLKERGWNPLVAGFAGIEQRGLKYNFRLILDFTGTPPKKTKPPTS